MLTNAILIALLIFLFVLMIYWYRQFKRAQEIAEQLYYLATEGCASYDNGVWHNGICEGEVIAGNIIEEARRVLTELPGRDKPFRRSGEELPF